MFASRCRTLAGLALVATALAGCGAEVNERATVVVGSGDDVRGELLAHIYAGAVRSAGVDVEVTPNLGDRAEYLGALDAGVLALVPDVTGELLATFDSLSRATEAEDVFVDLNRSLPEGLAVGDYALAEDRTTIAVASAGEFASATSLSDVAGDCGNIVLGTVDDVSAPDPVDVAARLATGYGCEVEEFMVYPDARAAVDAVESGAVGVLAVRTASFGPLLSDLTTLEDDESVFTAQNVVPLLRDGALGDDAVSALSVVAGELTTADLADMIDEVRGGSDSGDVAARWLGDRTL
ncbi:ABC transporter substrate-binding protein [Rhodococcus sp. BGS-1C]|uniref:glycine betaine ABC transporter substrate-binding protein n=1 Tax=unclassified Rhodococcus (in: high G+C Gram-positive bacteria) TaxID=192944 RepID=UPI0019D275F6|nr:glycine betaine ABC transporter substrate-binding protein [Rhodococcus sp. KRD197]